ncbi:MAG: bifunctional phosphopantothenoylcysteine decarboxylase/phosphopantothenate synthase, partial [Bacteroidaceae bacterium]|nr:bifunctional phosphopantothenoylcysteine decarboxylase/phosphopantothenate synthase [Bacteroidaceae bacterium]
MLKGKKIVLGITGSIAAYKACYLIRLLVKQGAEVQVVITPSGKEFITPLTLSTLTHKPVVSEFFDRRDGSWHSHVDLGLWADAMVIAPCTASTLAKMANGVADNMLITTYLSMKAPVFIAPAMDLDMYKHPATQQNIKTLQSYGNHFIDAGTGFLASGLEGKGRMAEPEEIVKALVNYIAPSSSLHISEGVLKINSAAEIALSKTNSLSPSLMWRAGERGKAQILITAGPTYEKIDPVRFIGNYSSGKMGFALAEECAARGYDVTLIAGPVSLECSPCIKRINVESAQEMYDAATKLFPKMDAAILCAAVADYRPVSKADKKIKRENQSDLTISLTANPDIAAALGKMKTEKQILAGFALETNDEETNAKKKLEKKNLDFIVLNSTRNEGTTFGYDDNKVSIISRTEQVD